MTVVPFKRPEKRDPKAAAARRSLAEFVTAMAVTGLVLFLLPLLWSDVSPQLLAVVHLLIAVVYVQQGPRVAAAAWIALTLVVLAAAGSPSPIAFALERAAAALDRSAR